MSEPGKSIRREIGYMIVSGGNPQELAMRVQTMLAQGFMPCGGVTAVGDPQLVGRFQLLQPLLKIVDTEVVEGPAEPKKIELVT
jgi:hypothetical protein